LTCEGALDAIKRLGADAAELALELRTRLAVAERGGQVWLTRRLIEVLAAVDPASRTDLPELDEWLRVREAAAALRHKMEDDTATIVELAAGLSNREVVGDAAQTLQEMGSAAAEALPALRKALTATDNPHRSYFADAIKVIEPWAPKPMYGRDELLAALRALDEAAAGLGAELSEDQRLNLAPYVRKGGEHTPQALAARARGLAAIHPRLREMFVSGLLKVDPALAPVLQP
jgi:hypothetical protein